MLAVVAIIYNSEGKLLLIQESKEECKGKWFFPGGHVLQQETVIDAINREVLEEAGIRFDIKGLLYIDQKVTLEEDRIRFIFVGYSNSATIKSEEDEHSIKAEWYELNSILNLDLRSPTVNKLLEVIKRKNGLLPIENIHILSEKEIDAEKP